jgi:hypothetical protein
VTPKLKIEFIKFHESLFLYQKNQCHFGHFYKKKKEIIYMLEKEFCLNFGEKGLTTFFRLRLPYSMSGQKKT